MPATPIDEQESNRHQHPADDAELGAGHENELLKPRLELLGESKVRQTLKKANQSNDRKKIPPRHVSASSNKELLPILRGFA
jgi:hypothetical protein